MKKNAKKLTNEELKQKAKSYGLNIENLHRAYIIENIKWYEKYKGNFKRYQSGHRRTEIRRHYRPERRRQIDAG